MVSRYSFILGDIPKALQQSVQKISKHIHWRLRAGIDHSKKNSYLTNLCADQKIQA